MNQIIKDLLESGISVRMDFNKETKQVEYVVDGFYKSGEIKIIETEGKLTAHARYNEVTEIDSLDDIIELNYIWWDSSKDRFEGWKTPDARWLPLLLKKGWVTEEVNIVKTYR